MFNETCHPMRECFDSLVREFLLSPEDLREVIPIINGGEIKSHTSSIQDR